jgi:hypothetical protein
MGGGSGRDHPGKIAGDNDFCRGPANTPLGGFAAGVDPAGAHEARMTAEALLAEPAMRRLLVGAIPDGFDLLPGRFLQQMFDGLIDASFFHVVGLSIQLFF